MKAAAIFTAMLALAASGGAWAQTASQGQSSPPFDIGQAFKFRTTPPEAKDFVRASRKPGGAVDYVPLAAPVDKPAKPAMTRGEILAREAELNGIQSRHNAAAGRRPSGAAYKSVAGDAPTVSEAAKPQCLITCQIDTSVANSVTNSVAPAVNPTARGLTPE